MERLRELVASVPWYSWAALAVAGISFGLALIYVNQGPDCSGGAGPGSASGWAWAATICGSGAMLLGVAVLARRRWMAALVSLLLGGFAVVTAALTGLC